MNTFSWISVMLSMILGLGITRLLSSAIVVFRSRGRSPIDWIPLVWAGCIFVWQVQFWWALVELAPLVAVWTPLRFLNLLALPLALFVASSLVLPHAEPEAGRSLASSFERDGRWALLFLSAFFLLATEDNWYFWHVSPLTGRGAINLVLAAFPLLFLSARARKIRCALTALNLAISLLAAWLESPHAYKM